jgi:hypothetical protein
VQNGYGKGQNSIRHEVGLMKAWSPLVSASTSILSIINIMFYEHSFCTKTIFQKWSFITTDTPIPHDDGDRVISCQHLSAMNAFECLNARGAIAHRKKITQGFTYQDVIQYSSSPPYVQQPHPLVRLIAVLTVRW